LQVNCEATCEVRIQYALAGKLKTLQENSMKKLSVFVFVLIAFSACEGNVKVNTEKLDSAGAKLQKTVQQGVDTVGAKVREWKDSLDKDDTAR
jgi:hypothetical protein